jgi:hypothetical protein
MPTDRSLNRVKKISRSRFGQQTLHIAKEESHPSAFNRNTNHRNPTKAPPQSGGALGQSAGRNRFKVVSGINGILPACGGPLAFIPFLA